MKKNIFKSKVNNNCIKSLICSVISLFSIGISAQNYQQAWTKGPIAGMDSTVPVQLATDSFGNTILAGSFSTTMTIGTTLLTSSGLNDIFIIKYSYNGTIIWAKKAGGSGNEIVKSITTDANDNIYLAGSFASTTFTSDAIALTKNGGDNLFVEKLDSNGSTLWAKTALAIGNEAVNALKADGSGNVYIAGTFKSSNITLGSTTLTNSGGTDVFIAKLDINGNVIWAKNNSNGIDDEFVTSLNIDSENNIYVAGQFTSTTFTIDNKQQTNTQPDGNSTSYFGDGYLAKLGPDGTVQWLKAINGSKSEGIYAMATDSMGNIVLTGYSMSDSIAVKNSDTETISVSNPNGFMIKFNNAGSALWAKNYINLNANNTRGNSGSNDYFPAAIWIDKNNYIYTALNKPTPSFDTVIAKFTATGSSIPYSFNLPINNLRGQFSPNLFNTSALVVDEFGIALATFSSTINTYRFIKPFCGSINQLPSGFNWYANASGGTALDLNISISTTTESSTTFYGARVLNGAEDQNRIPFTFTLQSNLYYRDDDGDGYGDASNTAESCEYSPPAGYSYFGNDCDDTNSLQWSISYLYPDSDSDGYGDHNSNPIVSCGPQSGYVDNHDDCDDSNTNLHGAYYFADPDGDGYVTSSESLICTDNNEPAFSAPEGYISSNELFTMYPSYPYDPHYLDCDNNNANINPGNSESYFDGLDQDCNGYVDDAKITTNAITSNTSMISCESVSGTQGYRFKVRLTSTGSEFIYTSTTNSFKLSQMGANLYSINENYAISVALKNQGVWQNYGSEKSISTYIASNVIANQCSATVPSLGNYIVNIDKITDAVSYNIWINNGESNYFISTVNSFFNFNVIPVDFKKQASKFYITVETKGKNGIVYNGATCKLMVPVPIKNSVNDSPNITKIQQYYCGTTLASTSTLIKAYPITGATSYRFKVIGSFGSIVQESTNYTFRLTQIAGFTPAVDTSYDICVALFKNGAWGDYGESCTVSTPAPYVPPTPTPKPQSLKIIVSQCGKTINYLTTRIYSTVLYGVTMNSFTFEVTNTSSNAVVTYTTPNRYFTLKSLPNNFGQLGVTYAVKVSGVSASGTTYPYSDSCQITTPAPIAKLDPNTEVGDDIFVIKAFPNPCTDFFSIEFESSSNEMVTVKLFDMIGRQLEERMIKANEVSIQKFGANYPTGMYTIVITQNHIVKNLKLIKK